MTPAQLRACFQQVLPGPTAHEAFAPYRQHFEAKATKPPKKAAVGLHFYLKNDGWHFLLIERTSYDGQHSGQMAFPGGKADPTDPHLEFTARRESFEEVGIATARGELLSELTMVWIPVSGFEAHPFVFIHEHELTFRADPKEVAAIVEVPLSALLQPEAQQFRTVQANPQLKLKDVPCFILQDRVVWGATALMLNEVRMLVSASQETY
ncbi:MAG: hypothetical protein RLZZ301_951 [Bacteroidota bacterium]|jgi:8-oxo-dGTP pyrophosphatase MutT (NUDIX family)